MSGPAVACGEPPQARRRSWAARWRDGAPGDENRFEKFESGRAGQPAKVALPQAWLSETNVAAHGVQVSCHVCPAHEHPACSQPVCITHMMVRWQMLLHDGGEAACGSATAGVLHVPASMPPHRCHSSCTPLTACSLPGITGDDGLELSDDLSRRADGAAGGWQVLVLSAPRLGSPGFSVRVRGVSLCRAPSMDYRACVGPRPRLTAQSLCVWARLHAEQRSSMFAADRATAFVGLRCRVVRSSAVIRYLAECV